MPVPTDPTDEYLMSAYASGDADAFDILYGRHRNGVYRYLLRQCGGPEVAEELFQDVWMRVIGMRRRYRPTGSFRSWLYGIAHNRLVDHYRQQERSRLVSGDGPEDPDPRPAMDHQAFMADCLKRLMALLDKLSPPQLQAFLLRQEGGLGLEDMARVMGVGAETAKSRLRHAMSRLRGGLEDCL
ncbi:MAG: sigma-70 family RNA polymerase sigma factor [Gammaproteobacteria bacterium]|nr:sigma-70 family RNA polymerase sigma factor [Gammaproteobacteria bacterium]